jgi:hypothetical protein
MHCIASSQILRQNNSGQAILYLTEIQIYKSGQIKIFRTLLNLAQSVEQKDEKKGEKKKIPTTLNKLILKKELGRMKLV